MMKPKIYAPLATSLVFAPFMLLAASGAAAQEAAPSELRLGAGHSDNITRTLDTDAVSASWLEAGFTGTLSDKTSRFESAVVADVTYRKYSNADFGQEVIGGGNAHLGVTMFESVLKWVADDVYGQTLINSFAPNAPQNRQGVNFFSTGPDLTVPLGARTELVMNARWGTANYDELLIDNQNRSATLGLQRKISAITTLRIEATGARIDYQGDGINPPIDARQADIGLHRETPLATFDALAGMTEIKTTGSYEHSPLFRFTGLLHISKNTSITMAAGKEYSDSAEFLRLRQLDVGPVGPIGPDAAAADPLHSSYANVAWVSTGSRATTRFIVDWRRERRQVNTFLDVDRSGVGADFDYRLAPRLEGGLRVRFRRDEFIQSSSSNRETAVGFQLAWNAGPRVRATAVYEHTHGTSALGGVAAYDENKISVKFGYITSR